MSLATLQLNDLNLFIETDGGQTFSEAGFALLTDEGIATGAEARANAWLKPQSAYNQYWDQLNQSPLPIKHAHARHHADIAFAQLKQLLQSVGNPEKLILAVPGHFTDQQLSLLLGLIKALKVEVTGVLDSAVVASFAKPEAQTIIEFQLYQTVITDIGRKEESIEILEQQCIPDLGIMQLHNLVAGQISHQLIDQYRYDPLHSSASEQQIYDLIPNWLQELTQKTEVSVQIESSQGELSTVIKRQTIAKLFLQRLETITASNLGKLTKGVFISQDAYFIPRLIKQFDNCSLLDRSVTSKSCLQLAKQFPKDQLERTTTISLSSVDAESLIVLSAEQETTSTHLLYKNNAYPIHGPISIFREGEKLIIRSGMDKNADVTLAQNKGKLEVLNQQADLEVTLPNSLSTGETLLIGNQPLTLIGVNDG